VRICVSIGMQQLFFMLLTSFCKAMNDLVLSYL
jgi:hypothetical protein